MTVDPVAFLEDAVRIPSHEEVDEMREFLVEALDAEGYDARVDDAGNTLATRGTGDPHVVLNTHVDTVSPHVPFERDGDVVRGRGACDAKGPLAAFLAAFVDADPPGRLTLAVTPDEETLSTGAAALTGATGDEPTVRGDAYVVGEPTGLDVCTAAKGRFQGTLALGGTSAHAAEPDSGTNAVAALEGALGAVREFDADRAPHPTLGPATLTPTVVEGGSSTNQVPSECRLVLDRRSVPPETAGEFRTAVEAAVRARVPADVTVEFSLTDRETPFLEAFDTPDDHPLVTTLADAATRAWPDGGDVRPFTAATEASYFSPAPTVVFGPGVLADDEGAVAHSAREYVRVDEVEAAARALTDALGSFE